MTALAQDGSDCLVRVFAKPRASKSRVIQVGDEAVEIALAAPPVDGAANQELLSFVGKELGFGKSRVRLEKGEASRHKVLRLIGVSVEHVTTILVGKIKLS